MQCSQQIPLNPPSRKGDLGLPIYLHILALISGKLFPLTLTLSPKERGVG